MLKDFGRIRFVFEGGFQGVQFFRRRRESSEIEGGASEPAVW